MRTRLSLRGGVALLATLAALLFAASPVTALAHFFSHHASQTSEFGKQDAPHQLCKLCVGLSAFSGAAPAHQPALAADIGTPELAPRLARAAYQPPSLHGYLSRAPPSFSS